MKLFDAIDQANRAGRLGLILYTIPNFPDPLTSRQIVEDLVCRPKVSILEMTFAVDDSFSGHANETIRFAHRTAHQHEPDYRRVLADYPIGTPSLCVLYEQTSSAHTFDRIAEEMSGRIDGILLEWDEKEHDVYAKSASRAGVELVQCIGPWMSKAEIEHILGFCPPNALVYLMSAPMTGAPTFPAAQIEELITLAKGIRRDIAIAAGFGIRTPEDVRRMSAIRGLDGVIIGTAFIEVAAKGRDAVSAYLEAIEGALQR